METTINDGVRGFLNPTEEFFEVDSDPGGMSLDESMNDESSLLNEANSQLAIISQVLMNMMIYMSQGGNFTRGDMVTTPNTFDA